MLTFARVVIEFSRRREYEKKNAVPRLYYVPRGLTCNIIHM